MGFIVQRGLQITDTDLQVTDSLLASLGCIGLTLLVASLELLDSHFQGLAHLIHVACMFLLRAELISQASSVNHGLLGLLLGVLSFTKHLLEVSLKCSHFSLNLPLGGSEGIIQTSEVVDRLLSIMQLCLGMAAGTVRLFQESARFFQFAMEGISTALSNGILLAVLRGKTVFILNLIFNILILIVDLLVVFVEVGVGLVGVVKRNL